VQSDIGMNARADTANSGGTGSSEFTSASGCDDRADRPMDQGLSYWLHPRQNKAPAGRFWPQEGQGHGVILCAEVLGCIGIGLRKASRPLPPVQNAFIKRIN